MLSYIAMLFFLHEQEVIMMLEQSTKDFQSLIDRLHVQKEFEQATKEGDRLVFYQS